MIVLWAFWHIIVRRHRIVTTRPAVCVVLDRCSCGQSRVYSEGLELWCYMRRTRGR